ncbi:nucleoside-diphosphate-sugar epimerase [Aliarcobacter faecis]|uniref:NAD-dependent epimerase/dehydratase family protein n=1 Tax=Aliarcobacter faecis TaxID=1564138 RepID=UPI00047C935A|nr:NAD(P)-dependent oxidoreductase [Aliarcobacter faecis]QKF72424.1 nucleoside-diphosphate-sugar epimerase [Aliarcobacter faecis]
MSENKVAFIAGASGVIGKNICKLLVKDGWKVYGTTRSKNKIESLNKLGIEPIIVDVYDEKKIEEIIVSIKPKIVFHQLTDLPLGLDPDKMEKALESNARLREIGTKNLVNASKKAGIEKMIAQSIAFVYEPSALPHTEDSALLNFSDPVYGTTSKAVASLEEQVLNAPFIGIILRNGLLYGNETGFDKPVDYVPPVHIEAAAYAAFLAINCDKNSIYNIANDDERLSTIKAKNELKWSPDLRLN